MRAVDPLWHEVTMNLNYDDGLGPFFAADARVKEAGGSATREFTRDGDRWTAKLYYQDSGIVHPGNRLPTGTEWRLESMREYRIAVRRHSAEDPIGEQKFNAHLRPRWQGMEAEKQNGDRVDVPIPDSITEGVNVRVAGANIPAPEYRPLLKAAADALGINARHFADPHETSTVQDAERYRLRPPDPDQLPASREQ